MSRNAVAKTLELCGVEVTDPFVFLGRHDHRNIAVLAANNDGFTLGGIQKGGEALFGVRGGNGFHNVYLRQNGQNSQRWRSERTEERLTSVASIPTQKMGHPLGLVRERRRGE